MIACRLCEHRHRHSPSPLPPTFFFAFLFLPAVRMHTHPWAKESKIDHTSNWSRCTGTGSSSRANLSHAGKIMHPELTAQHTRLPITSLPNSSCSLTIGYEQRVEIWRSSADLGLLDHGVDLNVLLKAGLMNVFSSGNSGSFNASCGLLAVA